MQREKYIDLAKGIGIIMVIFCHVIEVCEITSLNFIYRFCYSFHMPLFFFITGYCLGLRKDTGEKPPLKGSIKKALRNLLLPYIVWSFIYLFIGGNILSKERLTAVFTTRGIAPIWFLATLFCCQVFYHTLKALTYKLKTKASVIIFISVALVCLLSGYAMHCIKCAYNFSADTIGTTLYYLYIASGRFLISAPVLIGGYLFSKGRILQKLKKLPCLILGALLIVGVYLAVSYLYLETNIHLFETNNFPLLMLTSYAGATGILMISYSLPVPEKGILCLIGKNSLYFMLIHYIPFKTIAISAKVFAFISEPYLYWISTSLMVLALTAIATWIIKKGFFLERKKLR